MNNAIYSMGRFGLGLFLVGGFFLWVQQMRARGKLPVVIERFLGERMHYAWVGVIVGYTALPELRDLFTESARLAVVFFAGWFGMLVGLRLDLRNLRRVSHLPWLLEGSRGSAVALAVIIVAYITAKLLDDQGGQLPGGALLVLAGLCVTGTMPVLRFGKRGEKRNRGVGGIPIEACLGIVLAGLGSMQLRPVPFEIAIPFAPESKAIIVESLSAQAGWSLILGAVTGLVLDLLTRGSERLELFYLLAGGLALGCGIAAVLGLEPIWVGLVGGAWLINGTLRRLEILKMVDGGHALVRIGLYFSAGWLLGKGLALEGMAPGLFGWVLAMVVLLRPAARFGGNWLGMRFIGQRGVGGGRDEGSRGLPGLGELGLVMGAGLLVWLGQAQGNAVLAGVLVGQWIMCLGETWWPQRGEGDETRRGKGGRSSAKRGAPPPVDSPSG
jgi:hypothetical protein